MATSEKNGRPDISISLQMTADTEIYLDEKHHAVYIGGSGWGSLRLAGTPERMRELAGSLLLTANALDPEPEPTPENYSEYRCPRCGDVFGIAGQPTGSAEEYEAETYFEEQVEWHETGQCAKETADV